jgi:hypothetical protein
LELQSQKLEGKQKQQRQGIETHFHQRLEEGYTYGCSLEASTIEKKEINDCKFGSLVIVLNELRTQTE